MTDDEFKALCREALDKASDSKQCMAIQHVCVAANDARQALTLERARVDALRADWAPDGVCWRCHDRGEVHTNDCPLHPAWRPA